MLGKALAVFAFIVVLSPSEPRSDLRTSTPFRPAEIEHVHTALLSVLDTVKEDLRQNGSARKW
jgi:hypothetical protein